MKLETRHKRGLSEAPEYHLHPRFPRVIGLNAETYIVSKEASIRAALWDCIWKIRALKKKLIELWNFKYKKIKELKQLLFYKYSFRAIKY